MNKRTLIAHLSDCSCGGKARYRYRSPLHWVECRNKRCANKTRYYPDCNVDDDPEAMQRAMDEWNNEVSQFCNGRKGGQI